MRSEIAHVHAIPRENVEQRMALRSGAELRKTTKWRGAETKRSWDCRGSLCAAQLGRVAPSNKVKASLQGRVSVHGGPARSRKRRAERGAAAKRWPAAEWPQGGGARGKSPICSRREQFRAQRCCMCFISPIRLFLLVTSNKRCNMVLRMSHHQPR